ncbi:hypothetical protein GPECTOR_12g423 [Gonium pectorale]|uniref:Uncharacterized protein n=1 Tax=Gonium pectorale TaxID=33097 RepID=A0A150GQ43_GONPE|nr:hypothetical protein GPECTOR_12g423 [Gonium pectorale]|eukprot:KXZ51460.1 hypothetical protein GPECTOR_12g423 [Gonium pectorale]
MLAGSDADLPVYPVSKPSTPATKATAANVAGANVVRDHTPLAVVSKGITLRGLRKLRARLQATFGAEYPGMSTAEVNTRFVQVVTAAYKCRLAELPAEVEPRDVGVPRYFISHAWKNSFDLLLRGIEGFLSSAAEDTRVIPEVCSRVLDLGVSDVLSLPGDDTAATAQALLGHTLGSAVKDGSWGGRQIVILLDALDEADPPPAAAATDGGPDGASADAGAAVNQLRDLPPCVRFIVTTRPDAVGGSITSVLERAFRDNGGVTFVAASALRRPEAAAAAADGGGAGAAGGGGGGVLVYHTVASECFGKGPTAAAAVPPLPALSAPPTLRDLYDAYGRLFTAGMQGKPPATRRVLTKLMAVLMAAQEPLPEALLHSMGLGGILPDLPGYPTTWFVDEHHLYSLHKSLADWLADPRVSGSFSVDLLQGHGELAGHFLASIRGGAMPTPYMLKYLIRHLVRVRAVSDLEALLLDPEFLAAAFAQGHGYGLIADLQRLPQPSPLLYDCQRWLLARQHELVKAKTADDVMATALRCPTSTLVFKAFQDRVLAAAAAAGKPRWRIKHALGARATWPGLILSATGHTNVVRQVSWHPHDGVTFASGCEDGQVRIFNSITGECLATLQDKEPCVNAVAWRADGLKLAAAGDGKVIKLYDSASGQCDAVLEGHTEDVRELSWAPTGTLLASVSLDLTLRVWDTATVTCVSVIKGDTRRGLWCVAWSPDGGVIATGGMDRSIRLWDATKLPAPCDPDSPEASPPHIEINGHKSRLTGLAWSPDGSVLASSSADKTIRIWDRTGQCLRTLEGHQRDVICVAFRRDGKVLISGGYDSTVRFWDTATWTEITKIKGEMSVCLDLSPNGKRIASGTGGRDVSVMDAESVLRDRPLEGHTGNANCVSWCPGGRALLSCSRDRTVRIWDGDMGECTAINERDHDEEVMCAYYSPDGKLFASCSQRMDLYVHDPETGKSVSSLASAGHTDLINWAAWHPSSTLLASVSKDKSIRLWDLRPECMDKVAKSAAVLMGHDAEVSAAAFSPGGETLATGGYDKAIRLWAIPEDRADLQKTETIAVLEGHEGWVSCLEWHSDGRRLVSCGCAKEDKLRVWEVSPDRRSATCLHAFSGPDGFVYSIRWSPCGTMLASSSYRAVRIWDERGNPLQVLEGHSQMVMSVAWRDDGKMLASGGFDNLVMVYERI